jgi:acid phosphatase type 7
MKRALVAVGAGAVLVLGLVGFPAAAPAATATVLPSADTYVDADQPGRNFGTAAQFTVDTSPAKLAYLRFSLASVTGTVTSARLRLHTRDADNAASPSGGRVAVVSSTTWAETAVTYANRPAIGATVTTLPAVARDTWYEADVTPAVRNAPAGGAVSLALTTTNTDSAYYDSREAGALSPRLIVTTAPAAPTEPQAVVLAAGDIADCGSSGDEAVARLLDTLGGTVASLGDHAYTHGTAQEFAECYHPSWGRHRARTRPAVGNHEYRTANAAPYYAYFGAAAGDPARGYYSYDLAGWHVVVLNSNCAFVACAAGSAQERWLRADLAADGSACTLAYWHHPLFTSGANHGDAVETRPLFQALYDDGADLVLAGHNHNYERFAPQNPAGGLDNARGIRTFVVGTGGASHYGFGTVKPNSQARNADTYGVLRVTLRPGGYDWLFVPEAGRSFTDAGTGSCH